MTNEEEESTRAELLAAAQVYATLSLMEATARINRPGHEDGHQTEYRNKALRLMSKADIQEAHW